jgi:hypothetical protein
MTHRRTLLAAALGWALTLAVPAAAPAATAAVTADDGTAIPLAQPVTIRAMSPQVVLGFDPGEARYQLSVDGPDGSPAGGAPDCRPIDAAAPEPVTYAGNGVYTVRVRTTADPEDVGCQRAGEPLVATFDIEASTAVTAPAPAVLTRRPLRTRLLEHEFRVDVNPGTASMELRYARDTAPGPDGDLGDAAESARVDLATGRAGVTFARPGTYTLEARAVAGRSASPWSAPTTIRVLSPFDFNGRPPFSDDRGPSYRIVGTVRETTARGRIAVAIRRVGGGAFRRLASVAIRHGGRFAVRFELRRPGSYELRYSFDGSETVAPGAVLQGIRIASSSR